MKLLLLLSMLLIPVLAHISTEKVREKVLEAPTSYSFFQGDSGYITMRQGMNFIKTYLKKDSIWVASKHKPDMFLEISGEDTFHVTLWHEENDYDTVGKYYKSPSTGNYIACFKGLRVSWGEPYLLFEIGKTETGSSVLASEVYILGNYPCCWKSDWDGFGCLGSYIFIRLCATGVCYCSGDLYLFKHLHPQNFAKPIPQSMRICNIIDTTEDHIASIIKHISDSSVHVEYMFQRLEWEEERGKEIGRAMKKRNFTVSYNYVDKQWIPNDTTLLEKYWIY